MTEIGAEQAYNSNYDDFMAIPEDQVTHCTKPTDVATAEARELAVAAAEDREVLISMGLAPALIDSLMGRAQAFTYAVSKHHTAMAVDPDALDQWKTRYPLGYALRKELMRFLTFAYRKDNRLLGILDKIRQGRGHRDMIQDLLDLHVVATDNPEPLHAIPAFDFAKVAKAKEMYDALGYLLAKSSQDPKLVQATKETMNRAWTWYKMAADEVTTTGQFAFEGTDRYANYVSEYRQNIRKKSVKAAPGDASTEAEAV